MLIYVAGPYTAKTSDGVERNVQIASIVAAHLWKKGHSVICPHSNTHGPAKYVHLEPEEWIKGDLRQVAVCDTIVMLPGWRKSKGAYQEWMLAIAQGIPVVDLDQAKSHAELLALLPDLHPTEVASPIQCAAFVAILGRLYRTHLRKNADYSPANILATGQIGLATRLWDKVARLLNLVGFRITVSEATLQAPKESKNESIDDTLEDTAVYAIIGLLLRQGAWGR